jgi:hypothetical protein
MKDVIGSYALSAVVFMLSSVFSCTPVAKENPSPVQSLAGFIKEKYGVDPDTLQNAASLHFNRQINIPELELELVLPMMGEAGFEPCLILFDKKNTRFYNQCDSSAKYGFSAVRLENRVKQSLVKEEEKPEYLALPDSLYYKISLRHPVEVIGDYLNDAFADKPISEALFFKALDAYFEALGFARSMLGREEFIAQASKVLHHYIQENASGGQPFSAESINHAVYELNRLREHPAGGGSAAYSAIYQAESAATKVVSVSLEIDKLASAGPPYYSSADKYYYSLNARNVLLVPSHPRAFW